MIKHVDTLRQAINVRDIVTYDGGTYVVTKINPKRVRLGSDTQAEPGKVTVVTEQFKRINGEQEYSKQINYVSKYIDDKPVKERKETMPCSITVSMDDYNLYRSKMWRVLVIPKTHMSSDKHKQMRKGAHFNLGCVHPERVSHESGEIHRIGKVNGRGKFVSTHPRRTPRTLSQSLIKKLLGRIITEPTHLGDFDSVEGLVEFLEYINVTPNEKLLKQIQ